MRKLVIPAIALALAGCNGLGDGNVSTVVERDNALVPSAGEINETAPADNGSAEAAEVTLQIAPDGIGYALPGGRIRNLTFGTGRDAVARVVESALGEPLDAGLNSECGAGPLYIANYEGGFTVLYQDDRFAGWTLGGDDSTLTTASGVGIGTTRAELEDVMTIEMYPESTLVTEFNVPDVNMAGLLSSGNADAFVTDLWAGTTCMFR